MFMWWNLHKLLNCMGVRELSDQWTHPHTGRLTCPNSTGTETPVLGTLPDIICSSGCSSISFIIFFNKLVNINVSLSSVRCFIKLLKSRESLISSQVRQKLLVTQEPNLCNWHLKWWSVFWDWALNLWHLKLFLCKWCQNWVKL